MIYECPNCKNLVSIGLSCNSRFCSSCGNRYREECALSISKTIISRPHRQFVFSIAKELRKYFAEPIDRDNLLDILFEAEMNDDNEEADRLKDLLTPIGPMSIINIEKTLELIPIEDRQFFIDELDKNSYKEIIILKCLNCDFEEEAPYDIIEECWDSGPYPISYCPHCNKPKFVPVDIYNKKKNK